MRQVTINGIQYSSASDAARALGLPVSTVIARITRQSPVFSEWCYSDGNPTPVYKYPYKRPNPVWVYYFLTHEPSKRCYVGASGVFSHRKSSHLKMLRSGTHHCHPLQELFDSDPDEAHWRWEAFMVESRESALKMEQKFIEMLHSENRLLNVSLDGRAPIRHAVKDPEVAQRRRAGLDRWRSENRDQMSRVAVKVCERRWSKPGARDRWTGAGNPFSKKVEIEGKVFGSVKEASRSIGVDEKTIRRRCNNPDNKDFRFT